MIKRNNYPGEESETRSGVQCHRAQARPHNDHHLPSTSVGNSYTAIDRVYCVHALQDNTLCRLNAQLAIAT